MNPKKVYFLITLIILSYSNILSQNESIEIEIVNKIVELSRENNYFGSVEINKKKYYQNEYQKLNTNLFLNELIKYKDDFSENVSNKICREIELIAWNSKNTETKQKAIEAFISTKIFYFGDIFELVGYKKRKNDYIQDDFSEKSIEMLKLKFNQHYTKEEIDKFNYTFIRDRYKDSITILYKNYKTNGLQENEIKNRINIFITEKKEKDSKWNEEMIFNIKAQKPTVTLVGMLKIKELIPEIKELAEKESKISKKLPYLISLARMEDKYGIDQLLHILETKDTKSLMYTPFIQSIVFTRQKVLYNYLIEKLMDKNCSSPSRIPGRSRIQCGYVIMEQFPGIIKDYPLKHSVGTQIATDSYENALEIARKWFTDNPDYIILE